MSQPFLARRVQLSVTINGHNVTDALSPYLKDFSFKDNAKDKADEIQLTLMDRDGRWQSEWFIEQGSEITASLICLDWYTHGEDIELPMGRFTVDEVEFAGPPASCSVKAVSAAKTSAISEEAHTKGWETYTLEGIAKEIANRHGYKLLYDAPPIPFSRIDQREASDLSFLHTLASQYGVNLKVHDGQIILYGAKEWDAKSPCFTITPRAEKYTPASWSFKKSAKGTAKQARFQYQNPKTGESLQAETPVRKTPPNGQTLTLSQRAENSAQAISISESALRKVNEGEQTANMEWMGFPALAAGITLTCAGFGKFDGTYFVESVEHRVGQGYTTSAELRKTTD